MLGLLLSACERQASSIVVDAPEPRVASLVPAATSLILAMGLGEHLVAVSHHEPSGQHRSDLPRAGDYLTIDWETLIACGAQVMITQFHPQRMPAGVEQRARRMNIQMVNLQIESVADIAQAIETLGQALDRPQHAQHLQAEFHRKLNAVRERVSGKPPVRTLIVLNENGRFCAGPGTFLDDLLQIAGGVNAIPPSAVLYPSIDTEQLLAIAPDAILQLLPAASPQVLEQAAAFWRTVPDLPAVRNGRVYVLTDPQALLPGWGVTDLAEQFATKLHGEQACIVPAE